MTQFGLERKIVTPGRTVSGTTQHQGDGQSSLISVPIPDGSNGLEVSFAIDVSQVKAFFIMADKNLTIDTNSDTTPDDSLSLVGGRPYVWSENDYQPFYFGADITALFVTNASGEDAVLDIEALVDATP